MFSCLFLLALGHLLRRQREFHRREAARLRHRGLGAVADVGEELPAEGQVELGAVDVAARPAGRVRNRWSAPGRPAMSTYLRSSIVALGAEDG